LEEFEITLETEQRNPLQDVPPEELKKFQAYVKRHSPLFPEEDYYTVLFKMIETKMFTALTSGPVAERKRNGSASTRNLPFRRRDEEGSHQHLQPVRRCSV
jgi:hypothetical protein